MNYFEFYGIPESFFPDEKAVKAKFYELSRKYHPDFHSGAEAGKQREILELSTLNTNAYKTLSSYEPRLDYILRSHGLLEDGGKNELPPVFLMDMMELNERLMDLEFDFDAESLVSLQNSFVKLWESLEARTQPLLESYA
ncbi:MAG TPA: iron-sulfur cluster co-chaperone HscB C-terminal domain-containing protein, partial [Adhaeribacter sp.]|nr:iron-sulfur cluster co-chaperone HscB C-terminal domain-containing protein [Adhaeribacter sp.]